MLFFAPNKKYSYGGSLPNDNVLLLSCVWGDVSCAIQLALYTETSFSFL